MKILFSCRFAHLLCSFPSQIKTLNSLPVVAVMLGDTVNPRCKASITKSTLTSPRAWHVRLGRHACFLIVCWHLISVNLKPVREASRLVTRAKTSSSDLWTSRCTLKRAHYLWSCLLLVSNPITGQISPSCRVQDVCWIFKCHNDFIDCISQDNCI